MEKVESKKDERTKVVPSKEQVKEWIRRDMAAASYFLSMMLRYPDVIENLADQLYEKVMSEEHGAAIDHINKKAADPEADQDAL